MGRQLGVSEHLARCLEDLRGPQRIEHSFAEMIRFRALLIAGGYPDANDCNALRGDPALKMAAGRPAESGADLCSQPTISRLENLSGPVALKRMIAAMVDLFCDSFVVVSQGDRSPSHYRQPIAHKATTPRSSASNNHRPRRFRRWRRGRRGCRNAPAFKSTPTRACTTRHRWRRRQHCRRQNNPRSWKAPR